MTDVALPATPGLARLLVLMGSGELAPTMVKVHRAALERLGPAPVPSVLLDTPFGFQENARELAARAVAYFAESLHTPLQVASTGGRGVTDGPGTLENGDSLEAEDLTIALRQASYVFSGPGSPTYALSRWKKGVVPQLLGEKLAHGGAVTFASAAALTLGAFTVPVYEIYKVGEPPTWRDGLDLLAMAGLRVAVVPHYNNAEGGTHDTRFCYLGERRLELMEQELPEDAFVLGVDEHTSLTLDLEAGTAVVGGLGVVTVRNRGRSTTFATGEETTIEALREAAFSAHSRRAPLLEHGGGDAPEDVTDAPPAAFHVGPRLATSPLLDVVRSAEAAFSEAVAAHDATEAVRQVLGLEEQLVRWSRDIPQGDELDRARAALRALLVELGRLATDGLRDPGEVVGPYADLLLQLRAEARAERRFAAADEIRDRLLALGLEVQDTPSGTTWSLSPSA